MTLIAHTAGYDEEFSTVEIDEGEVDALVRKMADYVIQVRSAGCTSHGMTYLDW